MTWLLLESYKERLSICNSCDDFDGTKCKVCGCFMKVKAAIPMSDCPKKKWSKDFKLQTDKPDWFEDIKEQ